MKTLKISGQEIKPGERQLIHLRAAKLYDSTDLEIPVHVIHSMKPGPALFICAGIHGDEINGIEIIRKLLDHNALDEISGTLIIIPVVNIFGYNYKSRYLPDRRDLNRSFPGTKEGSLAARIAHTFLKEIVSKCEYGIDLHSGSIHRDNVPQMRANTLDKKIKEFSMSFGIDVVLNAQDRDGSLREVASKRKIKLAVFEGGEALRFNDKVTKAGVEGCIRAMAHIGMLPKKYLAEERIKKKVQVYNKSAWVRSSSSGTALFKIKLGQHVQKGQLICKIFDINGIERSQIFSEYEGLIVGINTLPLVTQGEALVHIAMEK